jgi:hypothetical protein
MISPKNCRTLKKNIKKMPGGMTRHFLIRSEWCQLARVNSPELKLNEYGITKSGTLVE